MPKTATKKRGPRVKAAVVAAKYKAAEGAMFNDAQAQEIGLEIERKIGMQAHPDDVVAVASDPKSPLHRFFQWNDAEAANSYRRVQARMLLNHLLAFDRETGTYERAFRVVRVQKVGTDETVKRYVRVELIKASPDQAFDLVQEALNDARRWKERYQRIRNQLEPVFEAIQLVEAQIEEERRAKK